ncbi:MAG: DUF1643 domain-containing protein [Candidatus Latescibacteria bacterium]|nr:DUF1643 domain-containing protein [Candidatus Latescibacterota bacterium]
MDATIDPTGRYRYALYRAWDPGAPRIAFVMLNPSTADAAQDDPTIRRCIGFARSWGYGALEVVNLFAYRATDPEVLRRVPDPVGPENDRYILRARRRARETLVAWGNRGVLLGRYEAVLHLLLRGREAVHCLGWTQAGHPRHPLYLKTEATPIPFEIPRDLENRKKLPRNQKGQP